MKWRDEDPIGKKLFKIETVCGVFQCQRFMNSLFLELLKLMH